PVIGIESSPFLGWDTTTFALGDLDGDGDLDIVQGRLMESRVWLNQGGLLFQDSGQSLAISSYLGTFPTRAIEIADMDGDGDLDIVNGAMCQVWFNNGYGKFQNSTQLLGMALASAIESGDLDGDGDMDLVVVNPGKGVFAYKNNGKGWFDVAKAEVIGVPDPDAIELADLDLDGDLDLIGRSTNVPIWFLKNEKSSLSIFGPMNPTLSVTKNGCGVSIVDFNQDGKMDLLHSRSERSVLKGDGRGYYRAVEDMPVFQGPLVKMADIDGDGDLDFISEKIWFQP
ncbi:MAG: VCBS repeat-containing protein, partial [Planctomycetota bacterium]|nr:VCBS repeat-containing protein [Planctomycetota bacterium]